MTWRVAEDRRVPSKEDLESVKTSGRRKGRHRGKKCRLYRAPGPLKGRKRAFYKYIRGREILESCLAH